MMQWIHRFINSELFKPVLAVIIILVFLISGYRTQNQEKSSGDDKAQTSQSDHENSDNDKEFLSEIKNGKSNIIIFAGLTAALVIINYKRNKADKLKGKKDD